MFCSTIIPTIGRSTLSRAVNSVLDQTFNDADFEVIVVNDSGHPLLDMAWQHSNRVRMINTNHRERSVARNAGAAIATGKYLHFLDDDDFMMLDALKAFWKLSQSSNAVWLYGSYQTVDNQGYLINEFHPDIFGNIFANLVAGESIPFQSSLFEYESFFAAGAFDPRINAAEDRDLGRRIALFGTVAFTSAVVAVIRVGEQGSTTDWASQPERDRWGREKALSLKNAYTRLHASANSNYWRGRVCRAYFASMVWNLTNKNLFTAASRLTAGLAFAGFHTISPSFWQGLRTMIK